MKLRGIRTGTEQIAVAKGRYQKMRKIPGEIKINVLQKLILSRTNTEKDLENHP